MHLVWLSGNLDPMTAPVNETNGRIVADNVLVDSVKMPGPSLSGIPYDPFHPYSCTPV
jgi:hypothetical protein